MHDRIPEIIDCGIPDAFEEENDHPEGLDSESDLDVEREELPDSDLESYSQVDMDSDSEVENEELSDSECDGKPGNSDSREGSVEFMPAPPPVSPQLEISDTDRCVYTLDSVMCVYTVHVLHVYCMSADYIGLFTVTGMQNRWSSWA